MRVQAQLEEKAYRTVVVRRHYDDVVWGYNTTSIYPSVQAARTSLFKEGLVPHGIAKNLWVQRG